MVGENLERKQHWERVYQTRKPTEVGWYQPSPDVSLSLIEATGTGKVASIIDVGGGASTLVDCLLERGYGDLTVLDVSAAAIDAAKARLGPGSQDVQWLVQDVTRFEPTRKYDIWHDRAVFHFLTEAADRQAYLHALASSLKPGGHVVISTFALDGPPQCSGLDVVRYSPETLQAELGAGFRLVQSFGGVHITPSGGSQSYTFCRFIRA